MFVRDKRDRAITCILCRDLHLELMFCGFYKKICFQTDLFFKKESDVWRKVISSKIIVTVVTQGLTSSFLSRPVVQVHYYLSRLVVATVLC